METEYQKFLKFFSRTDRERLDGLDESYFRNMTDDERGMAFEFLLDIVKKGGSEESVHGIFLVNPQRAKESVGPLLKSGSLRPAAQLAAAWNLYKSEHSEEIFKVFLSSMDSADASIRAKAARYVPAAMRDDLISRLQQIIRIETNELAFLHAVEKLLKCYSVSRLTVGKEKYSYFYRGLQGDDLHVKERIFAQLEKSKKINSAR